MKGITHLGRPLSLSDPFHRWMLTACAAAAVVALAFPGGRSPAAAMVNATLTVFLTWALVRELDPDHPLSALLGGVAGGAVAITTGTASALALAALMLSTRLVVRSTGLRPLLTDIAVTGAFVGALSRTPLVWAAGLALAFAVALDTGLPEPAPERNLWLAGAIGLAVTLTAVLSDALAVSWSVPGVTTGALVAVAVTVTMTAPTDDLRSLTDYRPTPLHPERLRAARLLTAGALALGTLAGGAELASTSWAGWAGLIAAGAGARWLP